MWEKDLDLADWSLGGLFPQHEPSFHSVEEEQGITKELVIKTNATTVPGEGTAGSSSPRHGFE